MFNGVRVAKSLVFYVVSSVLLFVCLSFYFLAMALSVYFQSMNLTVPLVSFAPLFFNRSTDFLRYISASDKLGTHFSKWTVL